MDPRTDAHVGNRIKTVINIDNVHLFDANTKLSFAYDYKQSLASRAPA
jgi:hypothetical protein